MGLERLAAVLQGKVSNFETDLFTPLIQRAAELTGLAIGPGFSLDQRIDTEGSGGFNPRILPTESIRSLAPDGETTALKGHDLSRAESAPEEEGALAPEGKSASLEVLVANASLRIIADHARAATFLINDGVIPANEGRGYVLRKILRRGIRHGRLLGQEQPFLYQMVFAVRNLMQGAYPELADSASRVAKVVEAEEKQFDRVLRIGDAKLEEGIDSAFGKTVTDFQTALAQLKPAFTQAQYDALIGFVSRWTDQIKSSPELRRALARASSGQSLEPIEGLIRVKLGDEQANLFAKQSLEPIKVELPGAAAFHLYETYGLPLDFIMDAARDAEIEFDAKGFEAARAEEQARARASWKGGSQKSASPAYRELPKTDFLGYKQLTANNAEVLAIVKVGVGVPAAAAGDQVDVVLDRTSFYGDSGGQVGDTGLFTSTDGNTTIAEITGCVLPVQGVRAHKTLLKQPLAVGDRVNTIVDGDRRNSIRRNHTGTHLLHAALRQVLGTHVKQAGSSVEPTRLRFDFSHFAQVADEELEEIESIVNREVLANARVETLEDVPIDVAVNEYHAMALFGEKYGDKVRVVKLSDGFSKELCGGTHTAATGEIGLIKIVSESSVSSGVRRLEAISGFGSLNAFRQDFEVAKLAGQYVPSTENLTEGLRAKFASQEDELKRLRRELDEARMKSAAGALDEALSHAVEVRGVRLVTLRADSLERGQLRTLVDNLKQKLGEGVVVLASAQPENKVALISGVTPGLIKRVQAGKLIGAVAKLVGGSGGGKPEIAEAGGKDQTQIDAALQAAPGLLADLLG
jgi:alanyl-tRNA synthetase